MSKMLADLERKLEAARDMSVRAVSAMRAALIQEGRLAVLVDALRDQEGSGKKARKR